MTGGSLEEPIPSRAWAGLAVAIAAMVLLPAATTGTNLAFPEIEADLDTRRALLSWILSGYSIATAAFTLLGGQLADRLGSRKMFLTGMVGFVAGAGISTVAPNVGVLICGRVVQGIGAALFLPSSLAMVLPEFPRRRHPGIIGIWAAAIPVGSSLSPTLTSFVLEFFSWRWVFGIQMGAGLGVLAVALWLGSGRPSPRSERRPDYLGVPVGTAMMALLALAIVQGPRWGWLSGGVLGSFAGALALLPVFVHRSRTQPDPLLDLRLFSEPIFRFANAVSFGVSMVGSSVWLLWPIHLTTVWGYSEFEVGLAITPTPVLAGLFSVITGRWAERIGYRGMLIAGGGLLVAANLWFVFFYGTEPDYVGQMLPGLALYGIAMGLTFAPLNGAALSKVAADRYGRANAAFNTGRALAGAIGVAALIAIVGDAAGVDDVDAFDRAFGFLAAVSAASLVATVLFWPKHGDSGA